MTQPERRGVIVGTRLRAAGSCRSRGGPDSGPPGTAAARLDSRPRLIGRSLPEELLESWDRALTAADTALAATTLMKVFAPEELRRARHRLDEESCWLKMQVALSKKGGG